MGRQANPEPEGNEVIREAHRAAGRTAEPGVEASAEVELSSRRVTVVGSRAVYGVEPGETANLELTEGQFEALYASGAVVDGPPDLTYDYRAPLPVEQEDNTTEANGPEEEEVS